MGFEPTTFCMASRRSSQLSYSRTIRNIARTPREGAVRPEHQMLCPIASRIMRTTIDLDPLILHDLKTRAAGQGKTLGRLASELLAPALARTEEPRRPPLRWSVASMGARVDVDDAAALTTAARR